MSRRTEQPARMPRFQKKPVVIEAEQYTGKPGCHIPGGMCKGYSRDSCRHMGGKWHVHTLEGPLAVSPGDWIITGVQGEQYPCKPDIFEQTYEAVA